MKPMSKEELEALESAIIEEEKAAEKWLYARGWTGNPEGQWSKRGETFPLMDAHDRECTRLLMELGWGHVMHRVDYASKLPKRYTQQYYQHPESGKIYSWPEAVHIAMNLGNSDFNINNILSAMTRETHECLEGHEVKPGNLVIVFMHFLRGEDPNETKLALAEIHESYTDWARDNEETLDS